MYTIANKHNKKTRKLSSSSRNKHKSKSKNKRKHKYTIGKTRKYTKSHNTIHIGGTEKEEEERKRAAAASQQASERRDKLVQQVALSPDSDDEDDQQEEVVEGAPAASIKPAPIPVTKLRLAKLPTAAHSAKATAPIDSPRLDSAAEAQRLETETEAEAQAKKAEAQRLKARAKKNAEYDMYVASREMYDEFITTIKEYNFKTKTPNETPYIQFSKFIQKIMGLQSSIKDDKLSKTAQTITDQILTAYSALISYECSNSLKTHFEKYRDKLNLKKTINIIDPTYPKLPSFDIDKKVSTINEKLKRLAKAQKCDPPSSQHIVEETVKDSNFSLRFPSFPRLRNPFKKSSDSSDNDTELNEITATSATSRANANDPASAPASPRATASTASTTSAPASLPTSRRSTPNANDASRGANATASATDSEEEREEGTPRTSPSITNWNSKNYRVDIEPKSGTGGGGKQRIIIFSDDGLRFAWGKEKSNVTNRANADTSKSEKLDFPNQVILIKVGSNTYIKINDVRNNTYRKNVCGDDDEDRCILVEGFTMVDGSSEKAWVFTFSTKKEKDEFLKVLNELCYNCVDKNREKIRDIAKDKDRPTSRKLSVIDDPEPKDSTTTSRLSSFRFGSILKSKKKIPATLKPENVFMSDDMHGLLNLNPFDETQLTIDYKISRQEIQHIIIDKKIKKKKDLIKILTKRKMETKQQLERDEKYKQENENILKEDKKQRAEDLIRQFERIHDEGYEALRYDPDKEGGSYRIRGKKKRTKRNKRRSYRKNRRTKRNVYKKKNKKNKKHKK